MKKPIDRTLDRTLDRVQVYCPQIPTGTARTKGNRYTYRGAIIERQTSPCSFRWICLLPGVSILRSDTLAGMRDLITAAKGRSQF